MRQAGNYYIHTSDNDESEVTIISRVTEEVVVWDTKWTRKSKRLKLVREEFSEHLSGDEFVLSGMTQENIDKLIRIIR
jgi:hypothetical protein